LLRRDSKRLADGDPTRIEVGTRDDILALRDMSRVLPVRFRLYVVQPGLSKQRVTLDQLMLLSVTENYLFETYQLPFSLIGSD
jgi:hypothetical protein